MNELKIESTISASVALPDGCTIKHYASTGPGEQGERHGVLINLKYGLATADALEALAREIREAVLGPCKACQRPR